MDSAWATPAYMTLYTALASKSHLCRGGFPHSDICGSMLRCQLPAAFRRLARPSSPVIAKASTTCTYSLDPITRSGLQSEGRHQRSGIRQQPFTPLPNPRLVSSSSYKANSRKYTHCLSVGLGQTSRCNHNPFCATRSHPHRSLFVAPLRLHSLKAQSCRPAHASCTQNALLSELLKNSRALLRPEDARQKTHTLAWAARALRGVRTPYLRARAPRWSAVLCPLVSGRLFE
jgi:hypothetical protein